MTATLATTAQALYDAVTAFGSGPFGVLSESLSTFGDAVVVTPDGWVHPVGGGRAWRVLCSEVVLGHYDDGTTYTTRCGGGVVEASPFCEAHLPEGDLEALCEHHLSAWLCADPVNHYPSEV